MLFAGEIDCGELHRANRLAGNPPNIVADLARPTEPQSATLGHQPIERDGETTRIRYSGLRYLHAIGNDDDAIHPTPRSATGTSVTTLCSSTRPFGGTICLGR